MTAPPGIGRLSNLLRGIRFRMCVAGRPDREIYLLTIFLETNIVTAMKRTLRQELRRAKPFRSLEEEVYLQILLTAQVASRWVVGALRPSCLTPAQFNVLRILRGALPDALPAGKIAERMVHHDPDLTRLLDRLESAGLVEKSRDQQDRRVLNVRITDQGLAVVETASRAVRSTLEERLGPVGPKQLRATAGLMEVVRAAAAVPGAVPAVEPATGTRIRKPMESTQESHPATQEKRRRK